MKYFLNKYYNEIEVIKYEATRESNFRKRKSFKR